MSAIRKFAFFKERVHAEGGFEAPRPITRVAGVAIFANPFAQRSVQDLSELFDTGERIGTLLMQELLPLLSGQVVSYGKCALVGVGGDLEHGHALIHPKLGRVMREPIGGGSALIPSTAKVCAAGASVDVPLGHKDEAWSFAHFDAMTIAVADAPRCNELVLAVALADGGRPVPRVGERRQ